MIKDIFTFQKIKAGDVHAFEALFRQYYEQLCRYACKRVNDMDAAEEMVQELFYKLWKGRENIQILLSVKSYLYAAIRNNSLQHIERVRVRSDYRQRITHSHENISNPQENLEFKELEGYIETALQSLPERRRHIFLMNRFEGKTYAEIASALSLSVKTVELEMSKALKFLRKDIKKYR